jgi:hypothetical protein
LRQAYDYWQDQPGNYLEGWWPTVKRRQGHYRGCDESQPKQTL